MSAAVVGVLLDLYDGTGTPISEGVAQLTPTTQLTDQTAGMLVTESPVRVELRGGLPVVDLLPNDAPGLVPVGSAWRISFSDVPGNPAAQTVQVPAGPASFIVAAGNPAVFTWTPPNAMLKASGLPNGTGITLTGELPAAFSSGNTYWVVAASGPTFQLARTPGGAAVATDGTGGGQLRVTQWRLSSLAAAGRASTAWSAADSRSTDGQPPVQRTAAAGQVPAQRTATAGAGHALAQRTAGAGHALAQRTSVLARGTVPAADNPVSADDPVSSGSTVTVDAGGAAAAAQAASLQKSANLSDLPSADAARTNLGLGTAAIHDAGDFAPAGSGGGGGGGGTGSLTPIGIQDADYTAAAGEMVPVDASGGSVTVTLPAGPADGSVVSVKIVKLSITNTVSIAAAGSDLINVGETTVSLSVLNHGATLQYAASDGTWYVLGNDMPLGELDGRYARVVSVLAFGATGDGSTDDTGGVQSAIDYASLIEGVTYFPAAMYRVSQLVLPSGAILQGVSSGTYPDNNAIPGVSVLARLAGTNKDLILIPDGSSYQRIFDIAIDGNKNNNTTGYGISIADGDAGSESQVIIQRCYVHDNPGSNIYLGIRRRANKVRDCVCNYSLTGDGITVAGSDNTIENNIFGSNARAGICLGTTATQNWDASPGGGNAAAVTHVHGNDIYRNQVGIALANGASDCIIMNNGIDRSDYQGVTVYSGSSNSIVGNSFHSNGLASHNSYGHIDVASGVGLVAIDNNNFGPQDSDSVETVAAYCVTVSGSASPVTGNIGVADPSAHISGLTNVAPNAAPWITVSSAGALIQGSGNDVLNLRNASGTLLTRVTNGGSLVHQGGGAQFTPNTGHVFGSTSPIGSANLVSLVGSNAAVTQLATQNAQAQSAPIAAFYGSDGSTVLAQIDASGGFTVMGLAGATAGARFAGGTVSGAPSSGTFSTGDFVVDQSGGIWVCTAGGSPGAWVMPGGGTSPGPAPEARTGNWTPADHGLIAWSQDPAETAANSQLPAAGTLYLCRVHVTSDAQVTSILAAVTSSNSTLTEGQCFAALYAPDGSLVAATDDQSRAWATSGLKTMPLSGGPVGVRAGDYYIGIYANGSTLPNFARGNNQIAQMVNAGLSVGFRFAIGATRLAGAPPSSAGDLSVSAFAWWLALS